MKPGFIKVIQFIAGMLVLMETISRLDSGFYFPWFYLVCGILFLSFVPLIPVLTNRYHYTGAVLFFLEGIIIGIIALRLWGEMKKYGTLIYMIIAVILILAAMRNLKKTK